MKYTYDYIADAINIVFQAGKVFETREVAPGVMIDFDKKGVPLYLEILDARKRFAKMPARKAVSYRFVRSSQRAAVTRWVLFFTMGDQAAEKKVVKIGKIVVDRDLCIGAASCIAVAPGVFELDGENKAVVYNDKGADDETILLAAKSCPTQAIIVYDEEGNQIFP